MLSTTLKITKGIRNSLFILIVIFFTNNLLAETFFGKLETPLSPLLTKKGQKTSELSKDFVFEGEYSEKFTLGHGDCGRDGSYSDCINDRGRVERKIDYRKGNEYYYSFSLYVPEDFNSGGGNSIAQSKIQKLRPPAWMLRFRDDFYALKFDAGQKMGKECLLDKIDTIKGKWTSFVVYANYGKKANEDFSYNGREFLGGLWVDGKRILLPCADKIQLDENRLVPKEGLSSFSSKGTNFKYGIYNSYVSRWLYKESVAKGFKPNVTEWVDKGSVGKGTSSTSYSKDPWNVDWGIEYPTKVLYYDAISISKKRPEGLDDQYTFTNCQFFKYLMQKC